MLEMCKGESVPPRATREPAFLLLQHHLQNTSPIPNELNFKSNRKLFSECLLCVQNVLFSFQRLFILK